MTDTLPWTEADRLDALAETRLLDSPPERTFNDIAGLVKTVCNVPIALVSLVDAHRQWFKANIGVDVCETPLNTSVCALAIRQSDVFVIPNLAADPRTASFSLVREDPKIRFYAGMPLITSRGLPLGTLCAIDTVPRPEGLTAQQAEALRALARQTVAFIEAAIELTRREEALSASFNVGTWDWDVENDRVTADTRFATLYGVDPWLAERGAPLAQFFKNIHPADREAVEAAVARAIATGGAFNVEYRLVQPDGSPRWVLAQGRCSLTPDGKPLRFPGVTFDITERKGAEVRQAALLEFNDRIRNLETSAEIAFTGAEILGRTLGVSRAGYGTIDPDNETIFIERDWNAPGITTLAGTLHFRDYGSYIEDLKRGETAIVSDAYTDPRTRDTADALKNISAQSFINMPLTEQGGFVALLYVNHESARTWSSDDLAFMREIAERTRSAAERRRVEQELAALTRSLETQVEARTGELMAAEERLRQSAKMEAVGQLTGGLAHDFNNMLMGISGALEVMQTRITQGRINDLERYASAAQSAAKRAAALTHRLLAFSRRQTLDPKPCDINRLVGGLEDLIRRSIGPQIDLEIVGAAGLWPAIVDHNQLENAILNLCINARDAMPDGGRITIETANKWLDARTGRERDLDPGQYISICVTDTGTGMDDETKARAFDPFYTTKPLGEGTGLGLSMIYGFARQSGGQVRIYTELGVGTTMCIYLPRHYGDAEAEPLAEAGLPAIEPAPEGNVILVVDDEATIRMLVCELLEEMGHATLEAHDGESALRLLHSNTRIDLLITDVGLPGALNGRQVADAARGVRPDLKVLFITGYAENAVIGNGQLDPNMQLITKPFAMEGLATKVSDLLGTSF